MRINKKNSLVGELSQVALRRKFEAIKEREMKYGMFGLGILGMFVGAFMMFWGSSNREIRDTELAFIGFGFLIALVSLIVVFVAKVTISQRSKESGSLFK